MKSMCLMVADLSVAWPFKIANVRFWAKFGPTPTKDRKKVVFEMGYCQKWMSIVDNRSFPKQYATYCPLSIIDHFQNSTQHIYNLLAHTKISRNVYC